MKDRRQKTEVRSQKSEVKSQKSRDFKIFTFHFSLFTSQRGVALLMVLWVMVFLTVIVSEFAHSMRVEINITKNFKEEAEALSLSEAGLNLAFAEILKDSDYMVSDEGDVVFVKKGINYKESPLKNKPLRNGIKLGSGGIHYSIMDEDSKININAASRDTIIKLLTLSGVEAGEILDTIADSIEDWRDDDSLHRLNGAEEDYYMGLPVPYHCKNANFDTVEELLMVKGMTPEILYGNIEAGKTNLTETGETDSQGEGIGVRDKYTGIYQHLTVIGSGQINLNTAPELLLKVIKGDEEAKNIISKRQENNGMYDEGQKSHNFTVISTGIIGTEKSSEDTVTGGTSEQPEKKVGVNKRKVKVICYKDGSGKDAKLTIKYWNDNYIPYKKTEFAG
ncbi:MAG: general secretion pathway protein GspK [Nitrospinae bacterium]|nr:general secretion pathway protein GspK [Nitrospinota bacterium]